MDFDPLQIAEPLCRNPAKYTTLTINIAIHIVVLFAILSLLYYFLISKVATDTLNNEIGNNIDGLVAQLKQSPEMQSYIDSASENSDSINQLKNSYSVPDNFVSSNNSWLFTTLLIGNLFMISIVTAMIITLKYSCDQCIPIGHLLAENAGTFILVGIIEALFFFKVAIKYIPIKPDEVSKTFLDEFASNLTQN